jgi:hypothetical protein
MSQLRHILRIITICLCCLAATASKVEQDATSGTSSHTTQLRLSLQKWGSKTLSSDAEQPLPQLHASPHIGSAMKLYGFLHSATSLQKLGSRQNRVVLSAVILVWLFLAIACIFKPWGEASHGSIKLLPPEPPPEETSHPPQGQYTQPSSCSSLQPTSERCASERSFNAQYRESKDEDKEALALLVRCNIIEADQFETIHQEHIDECVWIAKQMLQQQRLEEWVSLDRSTILNTVDAHLAARSDARANVFRNAAEAHVPRIQGQRNTMRTESGGSIASSGAISFGFEEFSGPPGPMPPMPCLQTDPLSHRFPADTLSHKSPVPTLHCDQSAVDRAFSDGEEISPRDEHPFPSVIAHSSGFHQESSMVSPPPRFHQESCRFSPPESMRLMRRPDFLASDDSALPSSLHDRVRLPVRVQEVMSAPPQAFTEQRQTLGPANASPDVLVRPIGQIQRPSHEYSDPMLFTFGTEAASSSQPAPNFRPASASWA